MVTLCRVSVLKRLFIEMHHRKIIGCVEGVFPLRGIIYLTDRIYIKIGMLQCASDGYLELSAWSVTSGLCPQCSCNTLSLACHPAALDYGEEAPQHASWPADLADHRQSARHAQRTPSYHIQQVG